MSTTMGKRVVVTGGSGKAGQYVISSLLAKGHEILNLDLVPLPPSIGNVHTIKTDLTDSGQVFNAISSHFKLTQPFRSPVIQAPDAIIHLAGYARNMLVPDNETFRGNAVGAYNVVEAACKLGVKKIVLASSVCVYGVTFAEGDIDFVSFPVDETSEANPMDTYSISKLCCERIGQGFARRFGVDIYVLRIGPLIAPNEYQEMFSQYVEEPAEWKVHGWSYIDARDLGQICERCIQTDGLGYQVFNATNDEITNNCSSTTEFLQENCPSTVFTRDMEKREAPFSNKKIKDLLGFKEEHRWQQYYTAQSVQTQEDIAL